MLAEQRGVEVAVLIDPRPRGSRAGAVNVGLADASLKKAAQPPNTAVTPWIHSATPQTSAFPRLSLRVRPWPAALPTKGRTTAALLTFPDEWERAAWEGEGEPAGWPQGLG